MPYQEKPPYILSLDVGTSSTRALLFDVTGAAVPDISAQHSYKLTTSHEGEVSVDASMLLEIVVQTIDEVLAAAGPLAQQIAGVATDTFWHGLLGVNEQYQPLTPLLTWEDTRPSSASIELRQRLDERAIHMRTGAVLHASYWPAKLRWFATQQPDLFARVAYWLSFGEFLHLQLLGQAFCSLSIASGTGMLLTRACTWDSELLSSVGVREDQLMPLGDLQDFISGLLPAFASRWPELRDVPWFPAIGDGVAANIGSGCANIEHWALTIGTSSAMRVVTSSEYTLPWGLWLYLLDRHRAVLGGALSEGGNLLAWLRNTLRLPSLAEADSQVAALPPDGHGLTILPFPSGERSLGWHAEARMTIQGIQLHTSAEEFLQAGMEALSYHIATLYEKLIETLQPTQKPSIICSGGALLGSSVLRQIIADTLDTLLYPLSEREASARGVALLALEALGLISDVAEVPTALDAPVIPNQERGKHYREAAKRQEALYRLLFP